MMDLDFFRERVSGSKTKRRREKWMIWRKKGKKGSQLESRGNTKGTEEKERNATNGWKRGEFDPSFSVLKALAVAAVVPEEGRGRGSRISDERGEAR